MPIHVWTDPIHEYIGTETLRTAGRYGQRCEISQEGGRYARSTVYGVRVLLVSGISVCSQPNTVQGACCGVIAVRGSSYYRSFDVFDSVCPATF